MFDLFCYTEQMYSFLSQEAGISYVLYHIGRSLQWHKSNKRVGCLHNDSFKGIQLRGSGAALSVTQEGTEDALVTCEQKYVPFCGLTYVVLPLPSDAYDTAKMLCEKYYLAAPELKIEEFNSKNALCSCAFMQFKQSPLQLVTALQKLQPCYPVFLELVGTDWGQI